MSIFANLTTDTSIANEKDTVGGGNSPLESGLYPAKVVLAYAMKSDGGAMGLVLKFKTEEGREINQTLWMTSGTAKGSRNYYEDKQGAKQYLPGFVHATALTQLTLGKDISEVDTEEKVTSVYNRDAKAEIPTKVNMLVDLLNTDVLIGLCKQTVDKTVKNDAGMYVPTGETREENEIDKFFRASDRKTTAEIRGKAEEASFVEVWSDKWTGKVKNKASKTAGVAGAPSVGAPAAGGMKKPSTSLFA